MATRRERGRGARGRGDRPDRARGAGACDARGGAVRGRRADVHAGVAAGRWRRPDCGQGRAGARVRTCRRSCRSSAADYEVDFEPGGRARLGEYLAKAKCVLELPGARSDAGDAYLQAGRATVAHCDVLIAVWDGEAARGPGGTADVVQLALARGTPVVHVPLDPAAPATILWSAFDPTIVTVSEQRRDAAAVRPEAGRADAGADPRPARGPARARRSEGLSRRARSRGSGAGRISVAARGDRDAALPARRLACRAGGRRHRRGMGAVSRGLRQMPRRVGRARPARGRRSGGATGWRPISRKITAAATCSISCSRRWRCWSR